MLYFTDPFIITLSLSQYDLDNVERGIKHQIIIIKNKNSLPPFMCLKPAGLTASVRQHSAVSEWDLHCFLVESVTVLVSFWQMNVHNFWLTAKRTKPAQEKVWLGKMTALTMTPMG